LEGYRKGGAFQAAEKRFPAVILSAAKDLALRVFMAIRDSSLPAAPLQKVDAEAVWIQ
jgi:hypothetical protein